MKTASDELYEYLTGLHIDALVDVAEKIDIRFPHKAWDNLAHRGTPFTHYSSVEQEIGKGDPAAHRDKIINAILQTEHDEPAKFAHALRLARIKSDIGRDLGNAAQANRLARIAIGISIAALLASIILPLSLNRQDQQSAPPPTTTTQPTPTSQPSE